jgi:hypothetical protein
MKCRCARMRKKLIAYTRETDLPDDLRSAMEACPECRAFWLSMRRVAGLIALKRYEHPDEAALERCRLAVRRRMTTLHEEAEEWSWDAVWGSTMPAFRFAMAALFVALLGLHIFSASHLPAIHTTERSFADHIRVTAQTASEQIVQDERLNPEFPVMMLSNWAPRVEQGGPYQFIGLGR